MPSLPQPPLIFPQGFGPFHRRFSQSSLSTQIWGCQASCLGLTLLSCKRQGLRPGLPPETPPRNKPRNPPAGDGMWVRVCLAQPHECGTRVTNSRS